MIKQLLTIVIAFLTVTGAYNYVPLKYFEIGNNPILGSTITTIQGSDTLSASRTVINNNFSSLNTDKLEISTFLATTSMPTLTSIGTIVTGVWNATAIGVGYGGTGTTSPTMYQVILGNGSQGLTVASSTGTTGQFLTSNGAGAYPSWQTSAVDTSIAYTWTGLHAFNNASTTFRSIPYTFPVAQASASSTVLGNNGNGMLSWIDPPIYVFTSSATLQASNDAQATETTSSYVKKKEFVVNIGGTVRVDFTVDRVSGSGTNALGRIYVDDIAVGTERTSTGASCGSTTYSENISISAGSRIAIYAKTDGAVNACVNNFRIYGTRIATSTITTSL